MAPVDPQAQSSLSLGPVLDLIERWQVSGKAVRRVCGKPNCDDPVCRLADADIPALKALAEQHAAQLRQPRILPIKVMQAAADFLAAPRREAEAE